MVAQHSLADARYLGLVVPVELLKVTRMLQYAVQVLLGREGGNGREGLRRYVEYSGKN